MSLLGSFLMSSGGQTAIGSTANILGQLTGNIYNSQQTWKNREANYQMTDYLYDKDLENWNRVNEYNSPASQMERFKEAGLNPALMYDKGNPGIASAPPPAKESNQPGPPPMRLDLPNVMAMYQDFRLKQKNIDAIQSTIDRNHSETELKKAELVLKGFDIGLKPEQIRFAIDEMNQKRSEWPYDLQAKEQNVNKIKAEIDKLGSETDLNKIYKRWQDEKFNTWMNKGINIDHSPWYLGPASKILDKIASWFDSEDVKGFTRASKTKDKIIRGSWRTSDASRNTWNSFSGGGHHWSR